jgi:hypothetical protein
MMKFCEETWRLLFYFIATVYGFAVLWDKPWFTDPLFCWVCMLAAEQSRAASPCTVRPPNAAVPH